MRPWTAARENHPVEAAGAGQDGVGRWGTRSPWPQECNDSLSIPTAPTVAESGRVLGVSSDDRLAPKHLCFDMEPVPGELLYLLVGNSAEFLPGCLFSHQEGRKSELRLSH